MTPADSAASDPSAAPAPKAADFEAWLIGDVGQRDAILRGDHGDPFQYLGPHVAEWEGQRGHLVRVYQPHAIDCQLVWDGADHSPNPTTPLGGGLFGAFVPAPAGKKRSKATSEVPSIAPYRAHLTFADGTTWRRHDPYRFPTVLSDLDLYLIAEGTHLELWNALGARPHTFLGVDGFAFAVWAPNARRVSVVGDFCRWEGKTFPMRRRQGSGVWELFVPGLGVGETYKYEIITTYGVVLHKADPVGRHCQAPPDTASRTYVSNFTWGDDTWRQAQRDGDRRREPMAIYEVHLDSFARDLPGAALFDPSDEAVEEGPELHHGEGRLNYRTIAPRLAAHVKKLGFNYVEFLPVAEFPYDGSWGYQVTGYFAPTARFGDPDDFRYLVDHLHREGIGVLVDWVPAHFVKDAHGLGRFDGTGLYEHEDPRRGEHPDWGTYIFNYERFEVRNFLVSNALYWLEEFHVDGLRVDAVASMLYLDYSRKEGEWLPNHEGGRENHGAIELLREVNRRVAERCPGCFTVAEESTAWPGITTPVEEGGLGFTFKWNMGWMHDTLGYFQVDPFFRSHHHDRLCFAMVYEYSEAYVNPLSHDEVVHGKGSLWAKMPGDSWRKAANLRALYAYQYTRPGKVLLFMGSELGSGREWNHEAGLDWYLLGDPERRGLRDFVIDLGRLYHQHPSLWRLDHESSGFQWIACHDRACSVFAFARYAEPREVVLDDDEDSAAIAADQEIEGDHLLVILNLTPVPRDDYRLGAPQAGTYEVLLSSDDEKYGGSGYERPDRVTTQEEPCDGWHHSVQIVLPPLSAMVLAPEDS